MSKYTKLETRRAIVDLARDLVPYSHYLNATAGNIPGESPSLGCSCKMMTTNLDPKAKGFANGQCFGVRTAYTTKSKSGAAFNTCAGALGREWPAKPIGHMADDYHYLVQCRELLKNGADPNSLPDLGGNFPRQHLLVSGKGKEEKGLFWGDYCDQTQHFDCIGLVWYCFTNGSGRGFSYGWKHLLGPEGNFYGAVITDTQDWMDADLLVKNDASHIMMVYMAGDTPMIVQASNSTVGLNDDLPVAKGEGGWRHLRLRDIFFKA